MINIHEVKFMVAVREGPGIWDLGVDACPLVVILVLLIELVAHHPRLPGWFKV